MITKSTQIENETERKEYADSVRDIYQWLEVAQQSNNRGRVLMNIIQGYEREFLDNGIWTTCEMMDAWDCMSDTTLEELIEDCVRYLEEVWYTPFFESDFASLLEIINMRLYDLCETYID